MKFQLQIEAPPIREDDSGALRVGQTRVLLELVIQAFRDGESPETIVDMFPTMRLLDVYSVIAYSLQHAEEIDAYLARRESQASEVRAKIDSSLWSQFSGHNHVHEV